MSACYLRVVDKENRRGGNYSADSAERSENEELRESFLRSINHLSGGILQDLLSLIYGPKEAYRYATRDISELRRRVSYELESPSFSRVPVKALKAILATTTKHSGGLD